MHEGIHQRVQLLLAQDRYTEAEELLKSALEEDPTSTIGRYLLAVVLFYKGESRDSEKVATQLLEEYPENRDCLALLAEINIKEDEYDLAKNKVDFLMSLDPENVRYYNMQSRICLLTNYYDKALDWTNQALEIDPENMEALNMKSTLAGRLGDNQVASNAVHEALERNPNDPYTIANHARQLLYEGKVKESLSRVSEALAIEPTNTLAQYVMQEALKSRFWLYRMFFRYIQFVSKLTAGGSWTFIIGLYVAYRVVGYLSSTYPELSPILTPLFYAMGFLFLLSWVINPLMNLYLMTNKYGRLLLDREDKKMAIFTGASLFLALVAFGLYFSQGYQVFLMAGIFFVALMIPLGSFLTPYSEKQRKTLTLFTLGIVMAGVAGFLLGNMTLISGSFLGIFAYQWVLNGMAITSSSRKI